MSISAQTRLPYDGQKFAEKFFVKGYNSVLKYRFLNKIFINMQQFT